MLPSSKGGASNSKSNPPKWSSKTSASSRNGWKSKSTKTSRNLQEEPWSCWEWDPSRRCYKRRRERPDGTWETQCGQVSQYSEVWETQNEAEENPLSQYGEERETQYGAEGNPRSMLDSFGDDESGEPSGGFSQGHHRVGPGLFAQVMEERPRQSYSSSTQVTESQTYSAYPFTSQISGGQMCSAGYAYLHPHRETQDQTYSAEPPNSFASQNTYGQTYSIGSGYHYPHQETQIQAPLYPTPRLESASSYGPQLSPAFSQFSSIPHRSAIAGLNPGSYSQRGQPQQSYNTFENVRNANTQPKYSDSNEDEDVDMYVDEGENGGENEDYTSSTTYYPTYSFAPSRPPQSEKASVEITYVPVLNPEGYFKPGRVFTTFWAESGNPINEARTFVVMQQGPKASDCCILQPYATNSSNSKNANQNRAAVFAIGSEPQLCPGEEAPGLGMFPVKIEPPSQDIDPELRLDFGRVYTIDHNAKVCTVGRIDRKRIKDLESAFLNTREANNISENVYLDENQRYSTNTLTKPRSDRNGWEGEVVSLSSNPFEQVLHQDFKVHKSKSFRKGRVFKLLWSEPRGSRDTSSWSESLGSGGTEEEDLILCPAKYGETAYHSVRRFVIVKERMGHCLCVPILTYSGQGTTKLGVKPDDHALIYSSATIPNLLNGEIMSKRPIRMQPVTFREKLSPMSRINYSKIYTIEHNVKVCFIGIIHKDSWNIFFTDFKRIDDDGG